MASAIQLHHVETIIIAKAITYAKNIDLRAINLLLGLLTAFPCGLARRSLMRVEVGGATFGSFWIIMG